MAISYLARRSYFAWKQTSNPTTATSFLEIPERCTYISFPLRCIQWHTKAWTRRHFLFERLCQILQWGGVFRYCMPKYFFKDILVSLCTPSWLVLKKELNLKHNYDELKFLNDSAHFYWFFIWKCTENPTKLWHL